MNLIGQLIGFPSLFSTLSFVSMLQSSFMVMAAVNDPFVKMPSFERIAFGISCCILVSKEGPLYFHSTTQGKEGSASKIIGYFFCHAVVHFNAL